LDRVDGHRDRAGPSWFRLREVDWRTGLIG
jgi:hypothetical protein